MRASPTLEIMIVCCILPGLLLTQARTSNRKRAKAKKQWEGWISRTVAENDIEKFLFDSYQKMIPTECITVIWDSHSASWLRKISFCSDTASYCPYKFIINYEGGNVSRTVAMALKAGYATQCGGYMILVKSPKAAADLLHFGDNFRTINTRAKFLIWYQQRDLYFERDVIWQKIPDVVFFNKTMNVRTRRLSLTIFQKKWPPPPSDGPYLLDNLRPISFLQQGKWVSAKGHNVSWFSDLTKDLKGIPVKILVIEHPPAVIKYNHEEDMERKYAGTEVELIKALEKIMNFKRQYINVEQRKLRPGQSPVTGPGGNHTKDFFAALSPLIQGKADVAIGSLFILSEYLDFMDMSTPLDIACTSFLVPNPSPRPRYLALILPFNFRLWLVVVTICFLLTPLTLYGFSKHRMHANEYSAFRSKRKVIFTSFQITSQVAMHLWPRYWSVRLFVGWYWLFTLLLTLAYKGAMVSFLTIPLFEPPIDTMLQLANSRLSLGGWGSELQKIFTQYESKHVGANRKYQLSSRYQVLDDVNDGISLVAAGEFALFENIRFLKFTRQTANLTKSGTPSMRIMKQCIVPVHMGLAYQKNSPLTSTINSHIRRFAESGLMKKWSARLVQRTRDANRANEAKDQGRDTENGDSDDDSVGSSTQRKQRVLSLADLQGAVYLLLFGLAVSALAFASEFFLRHANISKTNVNFIKKLHLSQKINPKNKLQIQQKFLIEYQAQLQSKLRYPQPPKKAKKIKSQLLPYPFLE